MNDRTRVPRPSTKKGLRARAHVLFALALALTAVVSDSEAQTCGGEGQGPCGIASCQKNLVLVGGKCKHPDCGRDGQRPCRVTERIPSCDDNLVELPGVCGVRNACGAEGQRPCLVIERVPSCNSKNLVERGGKCIHPPCGRLNDRACTVTERIPSCDETLVEIAGRCQARNACGAEGQRACTIGERTPSCNKNLAEVAGKCIHPDCGRVGQRACTVAERPGIGVSCDDNLAEAPGCIGECKGSLGMCFDRTAPLLEPSTNSTPLPPNPADPLYGYADLHVHMFANLAFGGGVLAGAPYDAAGGIAKALGPDFGSDLDLVSVANTPIPVGRCPPLVPNCGRNVLHGDHIAIPDDSMGLSGDGAKSYFGAPIFNGWPTWRSTTHQQVYYRWLERAWRGGMRVMVMLAVNNEFACGASKRVRGSVCTNSMPGIDAQLDAAIRFETWHRTQAGGGWFRIVRTPDEAEQTIREGKLAVVLGIEADTLFGCKKKSSCSNEFVAGEVDKYYAKGVRYIFPIHDFDTQFGGPALFMDLLGVANKAIAGEIFQSAPCPGISDRWSLNCNVRGLTPSGTALLNKLMDKGMMIDIDHMSAKAIDETFALADARGGYPFFVGHGLFNDVYAAGKNRHERMRTVAQLQKLKALGSVVSVMTQDELTDKQTTCVQSSISFAQNYDHAVKQMGVVAFGSDFNGMAQHVGPRFGDDGCSGKAEQRNRQRFGRLNYPFTIPHFGVFQKQVTGQRTFDFNIDGLAHIGLFPDLLADLMLQGFSIDPLMQSAKLFVTAWRKAATPTPRQLPTKAAPLPANKVLQPVPPANLKSPPR